MYLLQAKVLKTKSRLIGPYSILYTNKILNKNILIPNYFTSSSLLIKTDKYTFSSLRH